MPLTCRYLLCHQDDLRNSSLLLFFVNQISLHENYGLLPLQGQMLLRAVTKTPNTRAQRPLDIFTLNKKLPEMAKLASDDFATTKDITSNDHWLKSLIIIQLSWPGNL